MHFPEAINAEEMSMQLHKCVNTEQLQLYGEMHNSESGHAFITIERC